jgi:hypothetical protein
MTESSYYPIIGKYYLEHTDYEAIEIKFTRTNRLPFSCLPAHQESALLTRWHYKIPDVGIQKKPLDIVFKRNEAPLIAIYYAPGNTEIYEIPIRAFVNEKYSSKEKSLSKMRAAEIGTRIYL